MLSVFTIMVREGIEVALILGIVLAYLNSIGRRDRHGAVWAGAGAAALVSLAVGIVVAATATSLSHEAQEAFEAFAGFTAVAVLTYMVFWMRKQARHIKGDLQDKVSTALSSGGSLALAATAFFVTIREGLETSLFLFAASSSDEAVPAGQVLLGGALGLAVAAVIGYLIYKGSMRLNLRMFFRVTGAVIILVAAGLIGYGIHELQELGWITWGTGRAFDIGAILPDGSANPLRILFLYNANPTILEFSLWLTYVVVVGYLFFRTPKHIAAPPPEVDAAEPAPDRPSARSTS